MFLADFHLTIGYVFLVSDRTETYPHFQRSVFSDRKSTGRNVKTAPTYQRTWTRTTITSRAYLYYMHTLSNLPACKQSSSIIHGNGSAFMPITSRFYYV